MIRVFLLLALSLVMAGREASLDVPFVRQEKQGCGAASVAMVMQYWANQGARVSTSAADPSEIYRVLYRRELRGSSGGDMVAYLRDHAFAAFAVEAKWSDLAGSLARGRPVIVCLGPSRNAPLHYVVVIGLDDSTVVIHDPAQGARVTMRVASFQAEWMCTGNWALITTPDKIP